MNEQTIVDVKTLRVNLDAVLQQMKAPVERFNEPGTSNGARERALAITNLQQAIMWLGMELKELGQSNPYPNSYQPKNATVDPTADGLKL